MIVIDQQIIERNKLKNASLENIEGRDIFIAFNEPAFKISGKDDDASKLDSKLNARFITHFLPTIHIARKMKRRPRLFVISGVNMALVWNAKNTEEEKIMLANNSIKIDFLRTFFEKYFYDEFSLVEYIVAQDMLKISEKKIIEVWKHLESHYKNELEKIRFQLAKFMYPKKFNQANFDALTKKEKDSLYTVDILNALKYAISHIFVFGDINFKGNYYHNPDGYVSVGNEHEKFFNQVRYLAYQYLKDNGESFFNKQIIKMDNTKIVIKDSHRVPPPYNGMYKSIGSKNGGKKALLEVTYENERALSYYATQPKLYSQMQYMYENFISEKEYQQFWEEYKKRYFDLKARYKEAYNIGDSW